MSLGHRSESGKQQQLQNQCLSITQSSHRLLLFCSLIKGITPKIRMLCFVLINSVWISGHNIIVSRTVLCFGFLTAGFSDSVTFQFSFTFFFVCPPVVVLTSFSIVKGMTYHSKPKRVLLLLFLLLRLLLLFLLLLLLLLYYDLSLKNPA